MPLMLRLYDIFLLSTMTVTYQICYSLVMNLVFAGGPCSGKSTSAMKLFTHYKETGVAVELVPEFARLYIAMKRLQNHNFALDDRDQLNIQKTQAAWEEAMDFSCGSSGVHIISDSWSVLALLYMTDHGKGIALTEAQVAAQRADLICYCKPIAPTGFLVNDPNRVHSYTQSLEIDYQVLSLIRSLGVPLENIITLDGSPQERHEQLLEAIQKKSLCP